MAPAQKSKDRGPQEAELKRLKGRRELSVACCWRHGWGWGEVERYADYFNEHLGEDANL